MVPTDTSSISVDGCAEVTSYDNDENNSDNTDDSDSSDNDSGISGTYRIKNIYSDLSVDVEDCEDSDGSTIQQSTWTGSDCQQWVITPLDDTWHKLIPVASSSRSLDIESASTSDGGNAILWTYRSSNNQQFRFQSSGEGKWRIINRNSELCLAVVDSSTRSGADIEQQTCTSGSEHQMFSLHKQ